VRPISLLRAAAVAAGLAFTGSSPSQAAADQVDLALILAVDVSGSVDMEEARLQRQGYISAFTNSEVLDAITGGFLGKIAVAYVEWAGYGYDKLVIDWTVIDGETSAKAFAGLLDKQQIHTYRGTSISEAILFSMPLFDSGAVQSKRHVIDISGDGANNYGPSVITARDQAVAAGITINGLPIFDRNPYGYSYGGYYSQSANLDQYYERCVIGGRNAFVVAANGFKDFADAVRQKLVLEISDATPPARTRAPGLLVPVADRPPYVMPCDMPGFN
jgi:hypothetical protein